jgi:phosphate transport system permease protein
MATKRNPWSFTHWMMVVLTSTSVFAFFLIIFSLIWFSIPAMTLYGPKILFSTKFSNAFSGTYNPGEYGLLPALWGSMMVALLALALGFPVALFMAIFTSEFSLGGIGRWMEVLLAMFAGIPPIIYALLSIFVVRSFILPKFSGQGLPEDYLKSLPGLPAWNAGMLPNEQSTLLGGIFLALLIIPFMAPLMLDAIRSVPQGLKEASYGLGATRWYTLMRVTLPGALSGIVAAISLGLLKTIGDVVISAWTIGYLKDGLPVPLFDVFERVAPLTSTGAGLLNGLRAGGQVAEGGQASVAYFAALMLMVLAFVILGIVNLVQHSLHRRFFK